MPEQLTWNYTVQIAGGPTVSGSGKLVIDAYVKLSVTVAPGTTQEVEILPGGGTSLGILVIRPAEPSAQLSYEVDGNLFALDGPHVLIGAGAARLLAAKVGALKFTNAGADPADIAILAGKDVVTTTP